MKIMNLSSLKDIVIAVTYKCNSKCRMCSIWQKTDFSNEAKPELFYNLPPQLEDINISGGEPFMRNDLLEIIKIIKSRCPRSNVIISTNGFATERIVASMKKIIKIEPNIGVAVSLDGAGEAHDAVRRVPGGFNYALETIEKLKALGVKHIKIGFTIGDYNIKELARVYNLATKLKTELSVTVVHSSENFFGQKNELASKNEIITALDWLMKKELSTWNLKRWARAYYTHGMKHFVLTGKRLLPDYSGRLNAFVDPAGDVYPCDVSDKKMGNLNDRDSLENNKNDEACSHSWMVCTARVAIKKHWFKVGMWILAHKIIKIIQK